MLIINYNGSKWHGDAPDAVSTLLERLSAHALDPDFERFGNFVMPARKERGGYEGTKLITIDLGPMYPDAPTALRFWGNFYEVSGVFSIDTDEPGVIHNLTTAIRLNQSTDAYAAAKAERAVQAAYWSRHYKKQ